METRDVVIVSYARTPFCKANRGLLKDTRPDTLAALAIEAAMERAPGLKPEEVEDVIIGCAMPEGEQGMNVARIAALMAGLPDSVPAMTVNRFCSSGLQSVSQIAERIMLGAIDVGIAGGTESMSMVPMGGNKPSANPELMKENPGVYIPMGATAENVAKRFEVSREEQDAFALRSHTRAVDAWERGFMQGEVIPVETEVINHDGAVQKITVSKDDGPRPSTTLEKLARLPTVFDRKNGSVTPGNSSPLTDGAAAIVLMSKEKADELGLEILGYYRGFQVAGVDPEIMGIGPVAAVEKLLKKHDMTVDDIDLYEVNEAFSSQSVYSAKKLGLDMDKVNVNGGALALGHPLGVSGTRMTGTLLRALEEQDGRFGVVTMCIGGGMGAAGLFERVKK
ncbi:thiolase family protein [Bradymonas sediminis]|uniref:acetyl-CoA C-acyltransferase n=1 Tax=Bradymonas sediminis TaxID=1548548 RepID=A0A2Z4FN17_9DELT|nr:thiolase family protein [Bradymonas sediminis]AWV90359.1 acetyl-CoA C-acyltransferase [Bradymonas sediminis]TDP75663.1 acetyl-CoA acyltransferase [Bradymonas sediminis]